MLKPGEMAPSWSGTAANGATVSGASFLGRPLLLYFFPKAGTTGCTIETRRFGEHAPEFAQAGVAIVGVSVDSVEAQQRFASACRVDFPLISDVDKSIARAFGVLGLLGFARRVTFWIGADGRIQEVVDGMMPGPHLERTLARLATLPRSSDPPGAPRPAPGGGPGAP